MTKTEKIAEIIREYENGCDSDITADDVIEGIKNVLDAPENIYEPEGGNDAVAHTSAEKDPVPKKLYITKIILKKDEELCEKSGFSDDEYESRIVDFYDNDVFDITKAASNYSSIEKRIIKKKFSEYCKQYYKIKIENFNLTDVLPEGANVSEILTCPHCGEWYEEGGIEAEKWLDDDGNNIYSERCPHCYEWIDNYI